MHIRSKKILAREFLIFITCLAIGLLTYLGLNVFNHFQQKKVSHLEIQTHLKRLEGDSLAKIYENKRRVQSDFTDKYIKHFNLSRNIFTNERVWLPLYRTAKSDSVQYKWENQWKDKAVPFLQKAGFSTPQEFRDFILKNMAMAKDIEQYRLSGVAYAQRDSLQNILDNKRMKIVGPSRQWRTALMALGIAFIVLFVVRYTHYAIRWSIKTLKQPN
jgi:hypothetical protein